MGVLQIPFRTRLCLRRKCQPYFLDKVYQIEFQAQEIEGYHTFVHIEVARFHRCIFYRLEQQDRARLSGGYISHLMLCFKFLDLYERYPIHDSGTDLSIIT